MRAQALFTGRNVRYGKLADGISMESGEGRLGPALTFAFGLDLSSKPVSPNATTRANARLVKGRGLRSKTMNTRDRLGGE